MRRSVTKRTDHILFGMVLLWRYIVPTVKTTVNTPSISNVNQHREIVCIGKRVSHKIGEVGERGTHRESQSP